MSDWTSKGLLKQVTTRQSKGGKTFHELVIDQGGKYPAICVCTLWGTLEANEGDEVEAEGYMNGREYNGKYYAGLTCKTCRQFTPSAYQTSIKPDARVSDPVGDADRDRYALEQSEIRKARMMAMDSKTADPVTAQREKDADNEAGELPF